MKLALDVMGGDHAPQATVQGALLALAETDPDFGIILVGNEGLIESELDGNSHDRVTIHHAPDVIEMNERASTVLKSKPDSSLVQSVELVHQNEASGCISAGHTGAFLSSALLKLGRIEGARRPALGVHIPTSHGGKILCDVGANPNAKPYHLLQFAIMASLYLDHVEGIQHPRIGLINIGAESNKGSDLYIEAHELLKKELPDFIGNVEGRYLLTSEANVLICDGFVGNTLLKFAESWITVFSDMVKEKISDSVRYKLGANILKPVLDEIREQYDYEEHGGSPLLGVNGVCMVSHGSSSAKAIKNSILAAEKCVTQNLVDDIRQGLAEHNQPKA